MNSPEMQIEKLKNLIGKSGITAFISTFVIGILTHIPALTMDVPNHDGLASIYSSQNMLTSGRWFLSLACGISSYYTIPWLIGILALVYLGVTSVFLCRILEIDKPFVVVLVSGILVTFPAVSSTFAYVFTMDGYMLGLLLAVLAVYMSDKGKLGFLIGAVCLCLSMGIYQAYLPVAMLLSLYSVMRIIGGDNSALIKLKQSFKYVEMGVIGAVLYYAVLKIMLLICHETLGTYQLSETETLGFLGKLKNIYVDFFSFSLKGNVLITNRFALLSFVLLMLTFLAAFIYRACARAWYKSVLFYLALLMLVVLVPLCTNVILIVSPNVTYHLLMRYQWAFLIIILIAFINDVCVEYDSQRIVTLLSWGSFVAAAVITFSYMITDNIAYSNLSKKYEKTYAYCLRLADRIEQTDGYYQGIPIYMIGVVGDDNFPSTDITGSVTGGMIGMNGDYLLYTGENYELFFKNYMGITFNFIRPEEANFYYEDWYIEMPSFPEAGSTKVVNGILCIKTENSDRTGTE